MENRKFSKADSKRAIEAGQRHNIKKLFPNSKTSHEGCLRIIWLNCLTVGFTFAYGILNGAPCRMILAIGCVLIGTNVVLQMTHFLKENAERM